MKLKIFVSFAALSFVFFLGIYFALESLKFNATKYHDFFPEKESRCRLNSKLSLDQGYCHEAAAKAFLSNHENIAIDVFDYLCSSGYMNSCRVRDWNNYIFSGIRYTPPRKDVDLLLRNCFNMKVSLFEKDYYCDELEKIALVLNDKDTQLSIKLMRENFNYSNILIEKEDFFVLDFAIADSYNLLKCGKSNSSDYCKSIRLVHDLRMLMHESLVDKDKYYRLKSVVNKICQSSDKLCNLILNDSHFLIFSFTYRDIDYFKTLPLSFEASEFVVTSILQSRTKEIMNNDWLYDIKSPYLRYILLRLDRRYSQIHKECEKKSDKSGCFLGFKNVQEVREQFSLLKTYCSGGDDQSCILANIFYKGLDKYVSGELLIWPTFLDYKESLLGWEFTSSPTYKISSFIAQKRDLILMYLIFIILVFQIYIIVLFSKSSDVFKYIKTKTLEELKAKINR